ncbi:methyl-accepting chemotaxis protein [Butyrivibrio fibrisolvens DSM 3071]|uniref:Methyl-accepting chemotaxis protein n=1 Tax=Butyrivibrio fibrisolvens DSM 3071 TaxID=1121131 RepID=A0A1M5YFJ6_BUTFI|nr:methyl-accepting chemotaxis protein [Butyrivibrio fibrisolvens]SHI10664.1 methyl-accepting chemotaxis protein [Butyrivibrio fibrisolvens DSM 3071]
MAVKEKKAKTGKIRNKLLLFIVPSVAITVIVLITVTTILSRSSMISSAKNELNSSITNQGDNIEAWLAENLEFFSTAKKTIEATKPDDSELQTMLDGWYGVNSNSVDGLYIASATGETFKASQSEMDLSDPLSETWYKEGITRVNMAYGSAYKNADGTHVISASGILDDGSDTIRVVSADVTLDKISIIVNSGVKMKNASSFLVDRTDNTILAHRDFSLVSTTLSSSSSDTLLSGVADKINDQDYSETTIGKYMVDFTEISGTTWVLVSYIETDVILADVNRIVNLSIIIGLISVVFITAIILLTINRTVAPLSEISKNIIAMSGGDFTIDVEAKSNDEIGLMGDQINDFVKSMRKMLHSISDESDKLKTESDNSDAVSKTMYDASQSQSEAMKQLNETVDQLASAVNDIAQNATTLATVVADTRDNSHKAESSMNDTVDISKKGRTDMEQLSKAMSGISDSNAKLMDSIARVDTASNEITNIVSLIGEIAEETNLLSLNASIEAARAGEAGKGFAVVAMEIAKLAQTSAESATNIGTLINEVHNLIQEVVGQANESATSIDQNSVLIEKAVSTFDSIYENIQTSNDLIREMITDVEKVDDVATNVAAIAEEQAASADEILATSQNMVDQADNITKSSQDVANNAHELAGTSDTLTSYVQQFKI